MTESKLIIWGCHWATQTFNFLQRLFYVVKIWRLAGPLQDLEMLLTRPLLCCLGGEFGIIVMLKDPATFHLPTPLLTEEGFHSKFHDTWPHSFFPFADLVPLQENKHDKESFYQKVL